VVTRGKDDAKVVDMTSSEGVLASKQTLIYRECNYAQHFYSTINEMLPPEK